MPQADKRTGDRHSSPEASTDNSQLAPSLGAPRASGVRLLAAALAVAFVAEYLVMLLAMPAITSNSRDVGAALIDSTLMTLISAPLLWWFIAMHGRAAQALRQSREHLRRVNAELEKERREIKTLNRTLENRVTERTRELELANAELRERNRQLLHARAMAATDALTGMRNHRSFHQAIRDQVDTAEQGGTAISVIMLDIDGFKTVNDNHGHLAGDEILRDCAAAIVTVVPPESAFRYGGDEFAVLLPGSSESEAAEIAERLRRAVNTQDLAAISRISASFGIASYPVTARSAAELIYGADAAMYQAKFAGKNRVMRAVAAYGPRERLSMGSPAARHQ